MKSEFQNIKEIANEIILDSKKDKLEELKAFCFNFFKGIDQKKIDSLPGNEINAIADLKSILKKNKILSEVNKAEIDFLFNDPMKKYLSIFTTRKRINDETLKKVAGKIYDLDKFKAEDKKKFINFIGWTFINGYWEEFTIVSEEKDLSVYMNFYTYDDKEGPVATFHFLGTEEHKYFFEQIGSILT